MRERTGSFPRSRFGTVLVEAPVKAVKLAVLLLLLNLGSSPLAAAAAGGGQDNPPGPSVEEIVQALSPRHGPASPLAQINNSSCATSCSGGPEGSCTKSCPSSKSCEASCSGGKA